MYVSSPTFGLCLAWIFGLYSTPNPDDNLVSNSGLNTATNSPHSSLPTWHHSCQLTTIVPENWELPWALEEA